MNSIVREGVAHRRSHPAEELLVPCESVLQPHPDFVLQRLRRKDLHVRAIPENVHDELMLIRVRHHQNQMPACLANLLLARVPLFRHNIARHRWFESEHGLLVGRA